MDFPTDLRQNHAGNEPRNVKINDRKRMEKIRVATANVGTMIGKESEVADMLRRRRVDLCCVQEVRYKGKDTKIVGEAQRYKFWWSGNIRKTNGVGILLKEELVENVISVERTDDRIMKIVVMLGENVVHLFSVYAPQSGRTVEEKQEFIRKIEDKLAEVPEGELIWIGGDMNAHVGNQRGGFEEQLGRFSIGERNAEGEELLRMCLENDLRIVNTWFRKRREHLITYRSGEQVSQIDYILMRKRVGVKIKDCKVIPGEECLTQHRLLCCDVRVKKVRNRNQKRAGKIKHWKLKNEQLKGVFKEKLREKMENGEGGWNEFSNKVMDAAREVCGESKGRKHTERITWWWNEEVQEAIKNKKVAYKRWQREGTEVARRDYKSSRNRAKREVARAKENAWSEWSQNINTSEGRQKMFRVAKQLKKEKKDVVGGKYIKDNTGNIKVNESEIMEKWKGHFNELLNKENRYETEDVSMVEGPIKGVEIVEIQEAMSKMKKGKAPGPSGLTIELLKSTEEVGIQELYKIMQEMEREERIPREWSSSFTIPIYKGKGDAMRCDNYRGVRLLEQGMKLWEKILEKRLRNIVKLDEKQFGFQSGKSTTDAIFVARQLQEKYGSKKRRLYYAFVDLEKAFDRVPRKVIEWALRRQGVPERLIRLVMALYVNSVSKVKTSMGVSEEFNIGVGVHQGSPLSPLLFILVMQEATREIGLEGIKELLYADDLVIMADSEEELVERFEAWKNGMEKRGLKVNTDKTKVMISGNMPVERMERGRYPCGCCG